MSCIFGNLTENQTAFALIALLRDASSVVNRTLNTLFAGTWVTTNTHLKRLLVEVLQATPADAVQLALVPGQPRLEPAVVSFWVQLAH